MFRAIGVNEDLIINSINHCYTTLDTIDANLVHNGTPKLSGLVELANLSSITGNLLGEGCARNSDGRLIRNRPHTYPDLICPQGANPGIEIKVALEKNSPKGHLAKAGYYLTFRYVLSSEDGEYIKGKENRQDTVTIWEVKMGYLTLEDFAISNTDGDSGKTAVIKTPALNDMKLLYFDPSCVPYKHNDVRAYNGYN